MECRCFKDWKGGLVKANTLNLRSTISATEQTILVDVVPYIYYGWGHKGLEDVGCALKVYKGKGIREDTKALFLSYCTKGHLTQLIWSVTLRARPKFEGLSGVVLESNS